MDFIFGSNQNDSSKSKPRQKELRTQILIKQNNKKQKQLTSLQKFKLQSKNKLIQNETYQQDQFNPSNDNYQINQKQAKQRTQIEQYSNQHLMYSPNQFNEEEQQQNKAQEVRQWSAYQQVSKEKSIKQTLPNKQINKIKQNKSIPKRSELKVPQNSKLQSSKDINQIKSEKQISPAKPIKQIKSIKSAKSISPSKKTISPHKQIKPSKQNAKNSKLQSPSISTGKVIKSSRIIKPLKQVKRSIDQKQSKSPTKQTNLQTIQSKQSNIKKSPQQLGYSFSNDNPDLSADIKSQLHGQLYNSQRGMKFIEKKVIADRLGDAQTIVYSAQVSQKPNHYLKAVYENIWPDNQFIKSGVDSTVNNALQSVKRLIEDKNGQNFNIQKKIAPKHKNDLKQLEKLDKYRMIKIKQGQVKSKVGTLRSQLQKEYYTNKKTAKIQNEIVDSSYYAMDHPETLKAQNLIRQINKRRKSQHRHYKQMVGQKQVQKQRIKQIQKEYEQRFKEQRKQKLKQFYQQKHIERQLQKEQSRKKQQQFKDWIKMYEREKPLQQKLQQQMVMKLIIPEIQDRHKKLMKIKAEHKPIDIEEINEHEKRYMDFKRDSLIRQKAHIENTIENDHLNEDQGSRHYKGNMYEEHNLTDPRDVERSKKERQLSYSDQVRNVHQSILKRKNEPQQDTRSLVRRVRNHNGSVDTNQNKHNQTIDISLGGSTERPPRRNADTIDAYAEGLKNLQYVKSHIREKLMNGEGKKPKIQLVEIRDKASYLDDLKQQRLHNSLPHKDKSHINYQSEKNHSSILNNGKGKIIVNDLSTNDVDSLKARVENLDEKLKRREQKHKLVHDHTTMMDSQIENEYLDSINAKLKMVHELK